MPGTQCVIPYPPGPDLPPMGMRVRLKAEFDISGFPSEVQPILAALKRYGMILADNGSPCGVLIVDAPEESLPPFNRADGGDTL